jgi:hypothetical protein
MFSIFKKKGDSNDIPNWASFFTIAEYQKFDKEINGYFVRQKIDFSIKDGIVNVDENDFGFYNLGLTNVAQICKQENQKIYQEIITDHFNSMIRSHSFEKKFNKIADNFEEVKKYIGVRLYDHDYVAHIGKELTLGKDLAGDIYAMLVFDFPDTIANVQPEQIQSWNKSVDELFEIGKKNIRDKYPINFTKEHFGEFSIMFGNADHFFVPNIVFEIEDKPELLGFYGSIIGLPHRHSALIYPIENLEVVKAINGIIPAVYRMNQEGPGSLSNKVFWYFNNTFTELSYNLENNKLQFIPPEIFLEMMNKLEEK